MTIEPCADIWLRRKRKGKAYAKVTAEGGFVFTGTMHFSACRLRFRAGLGNRCRIRGKKAGLLKRIDLQVITDDSYRGNLQRFDVRADGNYALAFSNVSHNFVYVHDAKETFLYGFTFQSKGSYGIAFCNGSLGIYFTRSQMIAIFNPEGQCLDVQKVVDTANVKDIFYQTCKTVNGKEYRLERNIEIGDSFARFVAVDDAGEKVFYDTTIDHTVRQVVFIVFIVAFFTFVICGVIKQADQKEGENKVNSD